MSVNMKRDFQWIISKKEGVVLLQKAVELHGVGVWCKAVSIKSKMVVTTWDRLPP